MTHKNNKKLRKLLTLVCCAALLVCVTIAGTVAYLTSTDEVKNTFTVGQVNISLDEAKVGADGKALTGDDAARVKENSYKLMPGHVYDKDPTVHVDNSSEEAYLRVVITVQNASQTDKLFKEKNLKATDILTGYDTTKWTVVANKKNETDDSRTYVLQFNTVISGSTGDIKIFETIKVPERFTNDDVKAIVNEDNKNVMTITAYAVQKDGFTSKDTTAENADEAFKTAFPKVFKAASADEAQ